MRLKYILFIFITGLFLVGCDANISVRQDDTSNYLTITLTEQQAIDLIEKSLGSGNSPKIVNPQADLRNGEIFVSGSVRQPNTNQLVSGNLTIRLWADQGKLKAQVTSFNFAGVEAGEGQLAQINQSVANRLAQSGPRRGQTELDDVTIQNDEMSLTFKSPRRQ